MQTCPECGSDELDGAVVDKVRWLTCDDCDHRWPREALEEDPLPRPVVSTRARSSECFRFKLTQGALNHNYLHLRAQNLREFPDDTIGGGNRQELARRSLTWRFEGLMRPVRSDIDGDKAFIRERGAVGDWYRLTGARAGDTVEVCRRSETEYELRLVDPA